MIDRANMVIHFEETIIPKRIEEAIIDRDKQWIEWAESKCSYSEHYPFDGGTKRQCPTCWDNRKKEIGL
jgi:hypothetical protein